MPRVIPLIPSQKVEYQREKLADRCDMLLYSHRISKTKVAAYLGISPQALHKQFSTGHITLPVLMAIVTMTDIDPVELKHMLKVGD